MNIFYKNRYDKFINKIKNQKDRVLTGYTEIHHIQPKCLKGSDAAENLIKLTLREHFLAHWLLWKAYPNYLPLASAFLQMNNKNCKGKKEFQGRINSRTYAELKSSVYDMLKIHTTGQVYVKDNSGNTIKLSQDEYYKQSKYKFHTSGKMQAFDVDLNKWVYILASVYHENKNRYKSRTNLGNALAIHATKYQFIDTETNEIIHISKSAAKEKNKEFGYKRLVHVQKKKVKCVDTNGNLYYVPLNEYKSNKHTFYNTGTVNVFDTKENVQKIIPSDEYQQNTSRYKTSTKGKVLAKKSDGTNVLVDKKDFSIGDFVGQTKGLTTVLDKVTGQYVQISKDEFEKNKNQYAGPCTGKINVINKHTGERKQISKDQFDSSTHVPLGNKKYLFLCKNKLTNKEKLVNIYEWPFVFATYEIVDLEKFNQIKPLINY